MPIYVTRSKKQHKFSTCSNSSVVECHAHNLEVKVSTPGLGISLLSFFMGFFLKLKLQVQKKSMVCLDQELKP